MTTPIMLGQTLPLPLQQPTSRNVAEAKEGFGQLLMDTIDQVNNAQMQGEEAIVQLQTGEVKHLHEVMIAVEQADVSLRMLVQLRNRAQQAYEELMRLQI